MLRVISRSICYARVNSKYYNNKLNDIKCNLCKGTGMIYNKEISSPNVCFICNGTGIKK